MKGNVNSKCNFNVIVIPIVLPLRMILSLVYYTCILVSGVTIFLLQQNGALTKLVQLINNVKGC